MKRITLEIHYADGRTEIRQFSDGTYIIGRDTGAIPLHDNIVSGRHGELNVSENNVVYTDQGSTNGTFTADGVKLVGPITMTHGTELRMGKCKIILKAIHQPAAATIMQPAVAAPTKQERAKTMLGQPAPDLSALRASGTSAAPAAAAPSQIPADSQRPSTNKTTLGQPAPSTPPAVVASRVPSTAKTTLGQPAASVPPTAHAASALPNAVDPAATTEAPPPATADAASAIEKAPESSLVSQASSGAQASADESYTYNLDIGELIKLPMQDAQWVMKCIVMGLFTIIPIAGQLNLLGWLVACYQNRKQGSSELPPANFSYLSGGIPLFLAYLPAVGAIVAVNIVLGVITFFLPFLFFVTGLVNLAFSLALFAAGPAIMYLTVEKGLTWTSIRVNDMLTFIKTNTSAYTSLIVSFFIAGLIGGAGGIVVFGTLLTLPYSFALQAVILSEIKLS